MAETEGTRPEVLERKRVLMEEHTKSTTVSNARPVPVTGTCSASPRELLISIANETGNAPLRELLISIANETGSALLRECNTEELLISIANQYRNAGPRICKAPELLRRNKKSADPFDPKVVAIGPYHRGKVDLKPAEDHKLAAALKFTSGCGIHNFFDKVKNVAAEARARYADDVNLTDEEFTCMLFFDGCFLLHFIDCWVNNKMEQFTMSYHLHSFIMGDMFLLENQLPYCVLEALMNLKQVELQDFIGSVIGTGSIASFPDPRKPYHLLDLLRTKLLGPPNGRPQRPDPPTAYLHLFRSAEELREVGIKFRQSKTNHLRDIQFEPWIAWGTLSLPVICIDDLSRSLYLNMIALEMCPGCADDYGITSFVWFLDCLIDRVNDVRELREEGILQNALGSDKQVAKLFNELATDLAPDFEAYSDVMWGIKEHRDNKSKIYIYKFLHTHFSSPWTAIAFFAAVFLLILTVIQTIFAVFPRG